MKKNKMFKIFILLIMSWNMVPDAGACSNQQSGNFKILLDCPSDKTTTADVGYCCCNNNNWPGDSAGGYISRDACVCENFPNSISCSTAGKASIGSGTTGACDDTWKVPDNGSIRCSYECTPLSNMSGVTTCSKSLTMVGKSCLGGGNNACTGCHAASLNECSIKCKAGYTQVGKTCVADGTSSGTPTPTPTPVATTTSATSGAFTVTGVTQSPWTWSIASPVDLGIVEAFTKSPIVTLTVTNNSGVDLKKCKFVLPADPVFGYVFTRKSGSRCVSKPNKLVNCYQSGIGNTVAKGEVLTITAQGIPPGVADFTSKDVELVCTGVPPGVFNAKVTGKAPSACLISGQYRANGICVCPPKHYEVAIDALGTKGCRTKFDDYSDLFNDPSANGNGYPVCGDGRIAVNANNTVLDISTSYFPNSNYETVLKTSVGDITYPYTSPNAINGMPEYLYPANSRCACTFKSYLTPTPLSSLPVTSSKSSIAGKPILPGETFGIISSQNSTNSIEYSPVAISKDSTGTIDGRRGLEWLNKRSQCGCPNLNEIMVAVDPAIDGTSPQTPQGAYCKPAISAPYRVLVTFNPSVHDKTGATQVLNRASEQNVSGIITPRIALPTSVGKRPTQPYTRRIWACSTGHVVDLSTKACVFNIPSHTCSGSNAATSTEASAVPESVSGDTLDAKFTNAVNKKLSCCTSAFTKGYSNFKFDCIDNSSGTSTFDQLWASADANNNGGQLNAIVLRNSAGEPITGFFRIDGSRCKNFSEFGGVLQPMKVNPKDAFTGQRDSIGVVGTSAKMENSGDSAIKLGSTIPLPSGVAYNAMKSLTVPQSDADLRECPILVRAAIKVECGANPPLPALQTTFTDSNGSKRCTAAKSITVHTQIRQLTEIAGYKTLKTTDSVSTMGAASSISVGGIINRMNGGLCPDGATRRGDRCVYE